MKTPFALRIITVALAARILASCASQDKRNDHVERRQDHIDYRTEGRQDRREVRGEREDSRAARRFDSW